MTAANAVLTCGRVCDHRAGRGPGQWDLYLLDYRREGARFAAGSGTERRQTLGARWFGQAGALDWNTELVAQGGELQTVASTLDVRAWTLATDTGWRWTERPLQPRLGLKADIASGDGNLRDGRVGTFNALFPKSATSARPACWPRQSGWTCSRP